MILKLKIWSFGMGFEGVPLKRQHWKKSGCTWCKLKWRRHRHLPCRWSPSNDLTFFWKVSRINQIHTLVSKLIKCDLNPSLSPLHLLHPMKKVLVDWHNLAPVWLLSHQHSWNYSNWNEIRTCPIEGFHPSQLKAAFGVFPCRGSPWWIFWVATLRCAVRDRRIASSTGPEGQKRIEKVLYKVGWRHPQSWLETPFETFFFWRNFCLCPFNGTLCSGEFGGFEPDSDYEKILEFPQIPRLPNFCWIWVVKLIGLLKWWESWELWVYYPKKHMNQWIQLSIHSWNHGYIIQTETVWRYQAALLGLIVTSMPHHIAMNISVWYHFRQLTGLGGGSSQPASQNECLGQVAASVFFEVMWKGQVEEQKNLVWFQVPSRKLTYPPKMAFWRWFSFSQGGIC